MKKYDINIKFTLSEKDYANYDKRIDEALELIVPYGANVEIKENEYEEL